MKSISLIMIREYVWYCPDCNWYNAQSTRTKKIVKCGQCRKEFKVKNDERTDAGKL